MVNVADMRTMIAERSWNTMHRVTQITDAMSRCPVRVSGGGVEFSQEESSFIGIGGISIG